MWGSGFVLNPTPRPPSPKRGGGEEGRASLCLAPPSPLRGGGRGVGSEHRLSGRGPEQTTGVLVIDLPQNVLRQVQPAQLGRRRPALLRTVVRVGDRAAALPRALP